MTKRLNYFLLFPIDYYMKGKWLKLAIVLLLLMLLLSMGSIIFFSILGKGVALYNSLLRGDYSHEQYFSAPLRKGLPSPSKIETLSGKLFDDETFREFRIGDFKLTLPIRHPLYRSFPVIKRGNDESMLKYGVEIRDAEFKKVVTFQEGNRELFASLANDYELFKLPLFYNFLNSIPLEELWKDLFTLTIDPIPLNFYESPLNSYRLLKSYSLKRLVYNIYILALRDRYLPKNVISFGKIEQTNFAQVVYQNDAKIISEYWFLLDGVIYKCEISLDSLVKGSRDLLATLLAGHVEKEIQSERDLYQSFKSLSIKERGEYLGTLLLFSILPIAKDQTKILTEMVYYLEKNGENPELLSHLDQTLVLIYGTNFSTRRGRLIESPAAYLERKIDEEEKSERERILKEKLIVPDESESVEYHLQKAKDQKINIDKQEKRVID